VIFIIFIKFWPLFWVFGQFLTPPHSPSISAPLVVKKCPKLYIHIYRGSWLTPRHYVSTMVRKGTQNCGPSKCTKNWCFQMWSKTQRGEREYKKLNYPVNLPDMNFKPRRGYIFTEGRTRVTISPLLWISPSSEQTECNQLKILTHSGSERGEREYNLIYSPV